jgi:uncharacterized membrane protein YphA (DoxX/SURF4 family)
MKSSLNNQVIAKRLAALRIGFGIIWLIDAAFKFEPAFYRGILGTIKSADGGEPAWLNPWFHAWYRIIGSNPHFFAVLLIIIESLIALSLLLGIARRITYLGGALLSFLIWAIGEGFGGPYVAGSTDIGAGIIYVFVFLLLYAVDSSFAPAWSIEPYIKSKLAARQSALFKLSLF